MIGLKIILKVCEFQHKDWIVLPYKLLIFWMLSLNFFYKINNDKVGIFIINCLHELLKHSKVIHISFVYSIRLKSNLLIVFSFNLMCQITIKFLMIVFYYWYLLIVVYFLQYFFSSIVFNWLNICKYWWLGSNFQFKEVRI